MGLSEFGGGLSETQVQTWGLSEFGRLFQTLTGVTV